MKLKFPAGTNPGAFEIRKQFQFSFSQSAHKEDAFSIANNNSWRSKRLLKNHCVNQLKSYLYETEIFLTTDTFLFSLAEQKRENIETFHGRPKEQSENCRLGGNCRLGKLQIGKRVHNERYFLHN